MICQCGQQIGLLGLAAITDPIHYGASFSLGVELTFVYPDTEAIRHALNSSDYVRSGVNVYKLSGYINPFIVIEGQSGREYGSASHLKDAVLSVIENHYELNRSSVRFEAQTYQVGSGAPTTGRYDASVGGSASEAPLEPISMNPIDGIAKILGVTRNEAMVIGIGGAVVGVVLLKRLL